MQCIRRLKWLKQDRRGAILVLTAIVMVVVSVRRELIDWYLRRGYELTGETRPFPTDNKFGTPRQNLEFVVLKKVL